MKYTDVAVTFQEFPDEVSLCINISGCKFHCEGCHSPELWEDIGTELTIEELDKLIDKNKGITCIGFMGGNPKEVNELAKSIRLKDGYRYKIGWYWGGVKIPNIDLKNFDYIKIGPYIESKGGLDNPNTNQKFYRIINGKPIDFTFKFWKNGED